MSVGTLVGSTRNTSIHWHALALGTLGLVTVGLDALRSRTARLVTDAAVPDTDAVPLAARHATRADFPWPHGPINTFVRPAAAAAMVGLAYFVLVL